MDIPRNYPVPAAPMTATPQKLLNYDACMNVDDLIPQEITDEDERDEWVTKWLCSDAPPIPV